MTSPPVRISDRDASLHRLITPAARMAAAVVIMIKGSGVATVFWKMPGNSEAHALFHQEILDQELATMTLPNEKLALISPEAQSQMMLPTFDIEPVTASVTDKYTQLYEAPAPLARALEEKALEEGLDPNNTATVAMTPPVIQQRFEPMRQIEGDAPMEVESVARDFTPKPGSVDTAEKSDELLGMFHFAENNRTEFDRLSESALPIDPFPVVSTPSLQPLLPFPFVNLTPLLPL